MSVFPTLPSSLEATTLRALDPELLGPAANDSGAFRQPGHHISDINVLVAGVVGHVAGHVVPERVNITLTLAQGQPIVEGDPAELAFAISGVLTAEVRAIEEADGGDVRVEVRAGVDAVQVVISSDDLPPLRLVRALSSDSSPDAADPTLVHCRRLIEAHGGRLELAEHDGRIAFSLVFPTVMLTQPVRMFPNRRFEAPAVAALRRAC